MSEINMAMFSAESSSEDLQAALDQMNAERNHLSLLAKELSGYLDAARAREEAAAKVGAMSDAEREALRQFLK